MQFTNYFPRIPNVRSIYRGVDLSCYNPDGPVAGPLANQTPVRFLYLGGFPDYRGVGHGANTKGGETLLAAWLAAERDLISAGASLLIGGPQATPSQVNPWLEKLRDASRVQLIDRIHPDLVAAYMRASDVVLAPSMQEGLPNVVMEASACGRAVLGSNTAGIPEIIRNGETGLLVPPGEVMAWKNALITYATNIDQVGIMGQRARARMEALFDSKQYRHGMMDLYRTAMSERLSNPNVQDHG
jgi:glycosyltransferase involved in cell wall biosynthesis